MRTITVRVEYEPNVLPEPSVGDVNDIINYRLGTDVSVDADLPTVTFSKVTLVSVDG